MRALGLVAALLALLCLPLGSAQDPADAVALACAAVGGVDPEARDLLPLCPAAADPAPAPAADEAATPAAAPAPAAPQDASQLADEVVDDARQVPDDPASAPERALAVVATIVQFVKDALSLPAKLAVSAGAAIASAADAVRLSVVAAADAVGAAASGAAEAVRSFLAGLSPEAPSTPAQAPKGLPRAPDADGLLDVVGRAGADLRVERLHE